MKIDLDFSLLTKQNMPKAGVDMSDPVHVKYASDFGSVTSNLLKYEYGFGAILENNDAFVACQDVFKQVNWAKNLVVIWGDECCRSHCNLMFLQ